MDYDIGWPYLQIRKSNGYDLVFIVIGQLTLVITWARLSISTNEKYMTINFTLVIIALYND